MSQKVALIAAELGLDSDPFMLHLYAAFAEKKRALIGKRTKKALLQPMTAELNTDHRLPFVHISDNSVNHALAD